MPHKDPEVARQYRKERYLRMKANGELDHAANRIRVKKWKKVHPEQNRAMRRANWGRNKDVINAARRERHDAEYYKAQEASRRARMEADPELKRRRLESHRRSYERRREKCIQRTTEYMRLNPDKRREYSRTTAAKRRTAKGSHTTEQWVARFIFYGGCCAYCGISLTLREAHRDHVIPLVVGGSNWASNLVPACADCNLRKAAKRWVPNFRGGSSLGPV